jgi:hypothetical protein
LYSLAETYVALNKGFEAAANEGLTRLIIDLSNNGGGSICFGRSLIAYLQQVQGGVNYGPEDISTSPLQRNLTLSSGIYWSFDCQCDCERLLTLLLLCVCVCFACCL